MSIAQRTLGHAQESLKTILVNLGTEGQKRLQAECEARGFIFPRSSNSISSARQFAGIEVVEAVAHLIKAKTVFEVLGAKMSVAQAFENFNATK